MASPEHVAYQREGVRKMVEAHSFPNAGSRPQAPMGPMDSCIVRGAMGGVMGGALGVVFGMLMNMTGPMGQVGVLPPVPGMPSATPTPAAATAAAARGSTAGITPASSTSVSSLTPKPASASSAAASSTAASSLRSLPVTASVSSTFAPTAALVGPAPAPAPAAFPAMAHNPMNPIYGYTEVNPNASSPTWSQLREMVLEQGRQSRRQFKTWGLMSGTYASSECIIEKARGKSDDMNPLLAGCTTGAVLAARSGPQAIVLGCAGFASFSYAMEKVMHNML